MNEIDYLVSKAKRFLKTAELALGDGDYDSCVSRAYYAMFFMTEALLLTKDLRASTHAGVIAIFGEHFIKTGIFSKELGKFLRRAYDARQKGDYGIGFLIEREEAEKRLKEARTFVEQVGRYLREIESDET